MVVPSGGINPNKQCWFMSFAKNEGVISFPVGVLISSLYIVTPIELHDLISGLHNPDGLHIEVICVEIVPLLKQNISNFF